MASVNGTTTPTKACEQLNVVQGKVKVVLDDLSENELNNFLREVCKNADLRELRGFNPIAEWLPFRSEIPIFYFGIKSLDLSKDVAFRTTDFAKEEAISISTQTMRLLYPGDGRLGVKITYRRQETMEETNDGKVATTWGKQAYVYQGAETLLMLKRPRNHTGIVDNLILVEYKYQKVLHEDRHEIIEVEVKPLPFDKLHEEFGKNTAKVSYHVICNLAKAHQKTAEELKWKFDRFQKEALLWERLRECLSYPI